MVVAEFLVKWVKGIKGYRLRVIKIKSHGNLMYSMVTIVNNFLFQI